MSEAILHRVIGERLKIFAQHFSANRAADVRKRKLLNTEHLAQSLSATVRDNNGVHTMYVSAAAYGRYQDMRRLYTKSGGAEMIAAIEDWVKREGVANFNKGAYAQRNANKTPQQVANAVAWGLSKKMLDKSPKKRAWWNKGKTKDIETFYDELLDAMKKAATNDITT